MSPEGEITRDNALAVLSAEAAAALWWRGILVWKLWPQQLPIYETVKKLPLSVLVVVLLCARQFGKSVLGLILALEDCLQNEDIIVMIIAPTIKQARAIVRPRMKLLTRDMPAGIMRDVKSEDTWYFANGCELKLGGFDKNPMSQRGKTLYKIYFEETADSEGDDYLDFLQSDLGPALTHSKHAQMIHMTTLPKVPDHPFVRETMPEAAVRGALFKFTIDDNKQLTPEQREQCIKICGGVDTTAYRREYLCQEVREASLVLVPEFDEARHVKPIAVPEYAKFWLAGDTGLVRDMSCFHLCAYDFERAKVLFLDERAYEPHTASGAMVAGCREMQGERKMPHFVDASSQLRVDLAHQHQFPTILPRKDELEATVNQVRVAFSNNKVEIDPKCQLLIQTLRSGTFNKDRTDLARTKTLGHMDAFMSCAYGLRHVNKANPFPPYGGGAPHTHYIQPTEQNPAAKGLKGLFRGPR